jgi:hypothetical protein
VSRFMTLRFLVEYRPRETEDSKEALNRKPQRSQRQLGSVGAASL